MRNGTHKCGKCGFENAATANFCTHCGEPVKHHEEQPHAPAISEEIIEDLENLSVPEDDVCPGCGHKYEPYDELCSNCGLPLTDDITIDDHGDLAVIVFNLENFDFETHALLRPIVNGTIRKKIVLDITKVQWMDSTGIGAIVSLHTIESHGHKEIKIVGMHEQVWSAMNSLQVIELLDLKDSVASCRADWKLPPARLIPQRKPGAFGKNLYGAPQKGTHGSSGISQ